MNKKIALIASSFILLVVIMIVYKFSIDIETIEQTILKYEEYAMLVFLGSWIFRLFLLIPPTALIVLGGIVFSPVEDVILSTIGLILSSTLIFVLAKYVLGKNIHNRLFSKHAELTQLLQTYNVKILALGVLNPLVPADIICFLAAALGMKFRTYIVVIVLANTPLRILYSYLGLSFQDSLTAMFLTIGSILLVSILSINMWKTYKMQLNVDYESGE